MELFEEQKLRYKICNGVLSISVPGLTKINQTRNEGEEQSSQNIVLQCGSEEKTISANKDLLRQRIPYFNGMFSNSFQESSQPIVDLGGMADLASASKLIQFISKGSLKVCGENVQSTLVQADLWGLEGVKNVCASFMISEMNSSNCLELLDFGEMFSCRKLTEKCHQLICQELQIVLQTPAFLEISRDTLMSILQFDSLNTGPEGEDCLIKAVMKWYCHDKESREVSMKDVLRHIQLHHVSKDLLQAIMSDLPITVAKEVESRLESDTASDVRHYKECFMVCCGYSQSRTGPTCPRLNSVELFLPEKGEFRQIAFPDAPSFGVALNLFGRIVFFANYLQTENASSQKTHSSQVFTYRPCIGNGEWVSTPELFTAKAKECISGCLNKGESVVQCQENNCIYTIQVERCVCLQVTCSDGKIHCDYKNDLPNFLPYLDATHRELQAVCHQGRLYVLGGFYGALLERTFSDDVFVLSEDKLNWERKCPMLIPRTGFAVTSYKNKLIVSGGYGGRERLRRHQSCESYNVAEDRWEDFSPMQQSRSGHCMIVANDSLYVLGGKSYASQKLSDEGGWHPGGARIVSDFVELYEETSKEWLRIARMHNARCFFNTVVM